MSIIISSETCIEPHQDNVFGKLHYCCIVYVIIKLGTHRFGKKEAQHEHNILLQTHNRQNKWQLLSPRP